jgi:hypothetical protein
MRCAFVLLILALLCLLTACPQAAKFRDQQIAESHKLAQGDRITPPVVPPAKAEDFEEELPVDKTWPVLTYLDEGGTLSVKLLSTANAEQTVQWIHNRFAQMGYATNDNFSRILEGVTYAGQGKYSQIYVKVDLNSSEQVTVELRGTK